MTSDQRFRFRGRNEERLMILSFLSAKASCWKVYERMLNCGTHAWVYWSQSRGRIQVRASCCKSPLCPACRRTKGSRLAERIRWTLTDEPKHTWKLLTLTLQSSSQPLPDQVTRLKLAFKKLRSSPLWKHNCDRGCAVVEITWNDERKQWHPHLHCLIHSHFMPQKLLSEKWRQLTKGSRIVDIREIRSAAKAADYVSSYLAKPPCDLTKLPEGKLGEWVAASLRHHWLIQWGKALPPDKDVLWDELPNDWEPLGTLKTLLENLPEYANIYQLSRESLLTALKGDWNDHEGPTTTLPDLPLCNSS